MSRFISTASALRWPWQRTGLVPPELSIRTSEKNMLRSIITDAMCEMCIECSRPPTISGVKWTTLAGVTAT